MSGVDLERERAAAPGADPRLRLKRLKARARSLEKEEAYWSVAEAVELLFRSAEALVELGRTSAKAAEALDGICDGVALLLDGVG